MMPEFLFDLEQNSDAWIDARLGVPTASCFHTILAKGVGGKGESKTRRDYIHKLAGEIITGLPAENYTNSYMDRGHAMEDEARSAYAFLRDAEPQPVGFVRNGRVGASPDSIVGTGGLLEIKTKTPARVIECMVRGECPPEHVAQVQGQIFVCERDWCDLAVYYTGMPLLVYRVGRDEAYIAKLRTAVAAFCEELDEVVARVRAYSDPGASKAAFRASVILGDIGIA